MSRTIPHSRPPPFQASHSPFARSQHLTDTATPTPLNYKERRAVSLSSKASWSLLIFRLRLFAHTHRYTTCKSSRDFEISRLNSTPARITGKGITFTYFLPVTSFPSFNTETRLQFLECIIKYPKWQYVFRCRRRFRYLFRMYEDRLIIIRDLIHRQKILTLYINCKNNLKISALIIGDI
jgi:hypothetical protein